MTKKEEKEKLDSDFETLHKKLDLLYSKLYKQERPAKEIQKKIDKLKSKILKLNKKSVKIIL